MIVLDTNVLSELMRKEPAERVVAWVDEQDALAITAITVAELRYGVARLQEGSRRSKLTASVSRLVGQYFAGRVLAFDEAAAERYADLVVGRERRGRPVSQSDAQIAAICHAHDAALATRNIRDFERMLVGLVDPWSVAG